jgi:hypothetical protein
MAVMVTLGSAPDLVQDGISGLLKEVVATGVIRELDVTCNECAHHAITDEASGVSYDLVSDPRAPNGGVDLRLYVGQRFTIHGVPQLVGPPNLLFVTRLEPAEGLKVLPKTGGVAVPMVGVMGALLIACGLLACKVLG